APLAICSSGASVRDLGTHTAKAVSSLCWALARRIPARRALQSGAARIAISNETSALLLVLGSWAERPTIAILPFNRVGFRADGRGLVRTTVRLLDALNGRCLWAGGWDADDRDPIGFEERIASGIAKAIPAAVRTAEIDRAIRVKRDELTAWEFTMRALLCVTSIGAAAEGRALELLHEVMERAPRDPLPISLAAWCHGLRPGSSLCRAPGGGKGGSARAGRASGRP